MAIDGKYEVELQTILGTQSMWLNLKTQDNSLSGTVESGFGQQTFSGGTIRGNEIAWSDKMKTPFGEMLLDVKATVDDDSIDGEVRLGSFPPGSFKGHRV